MAKGQLTIRAIADQLGLSTCTVSRVMNNTPNSGISESTRTRVLCEIKRLGYQPNLSARALVTGKTHVIGAMIINSNNPFTGGFIYAMEEVAADAAYSVLLCNTRGDIERERNEINMLRQRGVEGLIIEHIGPSDILAELAEEKYPFVLLAPCPDLPGLSYVTFDDVAGGRIATEALIEAGRKKIAHIAGPENKNCSQTRLRGYELALQKAERPGKPEWIVRADTLDDPAAGKYAMEKLLELPESIRPDGVFCFDDSNAWGAYEAIAAKGLRVPEDIAIVGYNDESFASKTAVPLASIHLDTDRLGREASRILLEKIDGLGDSSEHQAVQIVPTLVRRASLEK
jgi:LacI family purine nucleotide synthesis repressor